MYVQGPEFDYLYCMVLGAPQKWPWMVPKHCYHELHHSAEQLNYLIQLCEYC